MNGQRTVYKLTLAAMFSAFIYVATAFLRVPLPGNGYANFGDCFVIVAGLLLGPVYGAAAAGIGSTLSDLSQGFALYAPATFVIKAAMAVVASLLYHAIRKTGFRYIGISVAAVALLAESIMVLGYFVFEFFVYGIAVAVADLFGNAMQGVVGLASATLLFSTRRLRPISRIMRFD